MKIIRLTVENFLKVVAVQIEPGTRDTVVISGKNGQGKSGVLNAIAAALAGSKAKKLIEPIHQGAKRAAITVETEELIITRTWTANGNPGTLRVKDKKERQYASPQAFLDKIIGDLSFDPLVFARSAPKDQRETLIAAMGVDVTGIDRERDSVYGQRTEINRLQKHHQAIIDKAGSTFDDVPEEPVPLHPILDRLKTAHQAHNELRNLESEDRKLKEDVDMYKQHIADAKTDMKNSIAGLKANKELIAKAKADLPDLDEIQDEVDKANATNVAINQAAEYRAAVKGRDSAKADSSHLTSSLDELAKSKIKLLAKAKIPIPGLGITDDGITFEGVPFDQISEAEKIRVSIAIAMTLNPDLRVISVANASLLDDDSLAMVETMAKENNYQVWLEIVKPAEDGTGFIIEDGELIADTEGGQDGLSEQTEA